MARPSKPQDSSDDQLSNGSSSSEEEQFNDQINDEEDEEELQAVARSASSGDEDPADDNSLDSDGEAPIGDGDEEEQDEGIVDPEIARREKARLYEMQRLKKQKIQEMLDAQNAAIDADMNNKGKGRLKYLLQQTELFAHFAKGDQSSQKKSKGRYG